MPLGGQNLEIFVYWMIENQSRMILNEEFLICLPPDALSGWSKIFKLKTHLQRRECVGEKNRSNIFLGPYEFPVLFWTGANFKSWSNHRLVTEPTGEKRLENMNHSDSLVNYHKTQPCGPIWVIKIRIAMLSITTNRKSRFNVLSGVNFVRLRSKICCHNVTFM